MKHVINKTIRSITQGKPFLQWLDDNLLAIWTGFLFAFIPLYPKIPLFSPIEQYIVRVRLEDIFIFIAFLIWIVYLLRGKVAWRKPLVYAILAYIGVGFLSILSAIFVIGTVPLEPIHLGVTVLHYFRYIQYFALFFIAFSAIKSKEQVKVILGTICLTLVAVAIYGFGQRHFYWPVYSTMNREFSKGIRLYLTEHARVQSTFAGHYDLGGYLVIVLPLLLALAYQAKRIALKLSFHALHVVGLWLLVVSAARTSFAAYLVAITIVTFIFALYKKTWIQRIYWGISRYIILVFIVGYTFLTFGHDIYDRFLQVLRSYPEMHDRYHAFNHQRKQFVKYYVYIPLGIKEITMPKVAKPENAISTDELDSVLVRSDTQPTSERPSGSSDSSGQSRPSRPSDVYEDIPDRVRVSTRSATGEEIITYEERDRTYSDNALRYGLSLAIRLDTLWPQAIDGFYRNPLVGSGYATLNKRGPYDFTEADSTDNNFLRTLGETGGLGFITFYGAIAIALYYAGKSLRSTDPVLQAIAVGYIAGTIGLLGNAIYIDVFAASKIAQIFWAMTGLLVGYYYLDLQSQKSTKKNKEALSKALRSTSKTEKSKKFTTKKKHAK